MPMRSTGGVAGLACCALSAAMLVGCGPAPSDAGQGGLPAEPGPYTVTDLTSIATSIEGAGGPLQPVPTDRPRGSVDQLRQLADRLAVEPAACGDRITAGLDVDPEVLAAAPNVTLASGAGEDAATLTLMDASPQSVRRLGGKAVGGTVFVERAEAQRLLDGCTEVTLDPGTGSRVSLIRSLADADVLDADQAYAVAAEARLPRVTERQVTVSAVRGHLIAIASAADGAVAQRMAQQSLQQAPG